MEPHSNEQSPSPSGSEELESDGDSEQEDELENDRSRDSEAENQEESDKENSDNSDEDDDEEEEEEDEDESEAEGEDGEKQKSVSNNSDGDKNSESPFKRRKNSSNGSYDDSPNSRDGKQRNYGHSDVDCYILDDLPLEVITTVEPTNYSYPVLKNMSNGVLTHRNIFTEHERAVLKDIINKYRNIVDTRSRTREIYLEKQSVWQQIVEEYNSTENIMVRTEKELRKCWDNMKYRAKQAEKEMCKIEKSDMDYDGMDLHTLAQQAIFQESVRLQQGGGLVKTERTDPHPHVKMEPLDNDDGGDDEDGGSNPEPQDEESWAPAPADIDREPALKKARQESPKLSSLLLAAAHKHTPSKKSGRSNHKRSGNKFSYNIPECTKVVHMKKKNNQNSVNSATIANINSVCDLPVSILPKGLGSCLSITNIPNPVSVTNHIGNNFNYQHKDLSPSLTSPVQSMKPMPSLKKMVPGKHQTNGGCKNFVSRSSKKSSSHGLKDKSLNLNNSIGQSSNTMNSLGGVQGTNSLLSSGAFSSDSDRNDSPEKLLSMKLTTQRLELERREHDVRMKLLEKELQSQSYQSQYWALRLKFLRSGRENNAFNMAGATNGDID